MPQIEETPLERELSVQSARRWNRYKEKYIPITKEAIKDVKDSSDELSRLKGLTNVDRSIQFGKVSSPVEISQAQRGGLGSGQQMMGLSNLQEQAALSQARGLVSAENLIESNRTGNMLNLIRMGQGESSEALRGLGDQAGLSAGEARADAEAQVAAENALRQLVGTGAGIAYQSFSPSVSPKLAATGSGVADPTAFNYSPAGGGFTTSDVNFGVRGGNFFGNEYRYASLLGDPNVGG